MTTITTDHRALESALDDGGLGRAVRRSESIATATPPPTKLLDQLSAALDAGESGLAETLVAVLNRRYEESFVDDEARLQRAFLTADGDVAVEQQRDLTRYTEQLSGLRMQRSGVVVSATEAVLRGSRKPSELVTPVERLRRRETGVTDVARSVDAITESTDRPARMRLLTARLQRSPVIAGTDGTVSVAVENVGTEPASEHTLRVSHEELDVTPQTVSLSAAGGERRRQQFTVATDATGSYRLRFELRRDGETLDTGRASVSVAETARSIPAAFDDDGDHLIDTEELQRAAVAWQEGRAVEALGGKQLSVEDLRKIVLAWSNGELV